MVASVVGYGTSIGSVGGADRLTLPLPAGLVEGDVLLAFLHNQSTAQTADANAAGWTRKGPAFIPSDAATRLTGMYARTYQNGDSAPTFVCTQYGRMCGFVMAVRGIDVNDFVMTPYIVDGDGGNSLPVPAFAQNGFVVEVWAANFSGGQSYAVTQKPSLNDTPNAFCPTGAENTGVSRSALRAWTGFGPVLAHNVATAGNAAHMSTFQVAFAEAEQSGMACKISDGSNLVDADWKVSDGTQLLTPLGITRVEPGWPSVAAMLATSQFQVGHRGGSRAFPEMSVFGYVQAAIRNYRGVEVSVARTSDGVWFGLHDETLQRTSPSAPATNASDLTWAQVQVYNIAGSICPDNPTTPARPYATLEEILDVVGDDYVVFVDPKHAMAYADELLDLLDTVPGSTDRFVAKFFGEQGGLPENNTSWALKARNRGYKSWGYFYQDGNFDYAARWDLLGMDYNASQQTWDNLAAAAPGKPIIGHVCATQANVDSAFSKGADGVIVSGITTVAKTGI